MKRRIGLLLSAICLGLCMLVGLKPFVPIALADTEYRLKLADETAGDVVFTGEWTAAERVGWIDGAYYQSMENGATASFTFDSGKLIVMGGAANRNGATLKISVDGGTEEIVEVDGTESGNLFERTFEYGEHTVLLTLALEENAGFRFDGFYYAAPSIGTGVTEIFYNDDDLIYALMTVADGYCFVDDKTGGKVSYTFDSANVRSVEIMADKNADSAVIEIFADGKSIGEANLKGGGQENVSVYTVSSEQLSPLTAGKKITLEIKVKYVNGNSYFVFRGLKINKYFNEGDWDKGNYVLDEALPDAALIKVEKDGFSRNLETDFSVVNGVLSNTSTENTLSYTFKGSAFEIRADKLPDGGKFGISVDGGFTEKVNLWSAEAEENAVVYRIGRFEDYMDEENVHTVEIVMLSEKSWYSEGNAVVIRGFNVYKREGTDEEYVDPDQFDLKPDPDYELPDDMEYKNVAAENYSASGFAFNGSMYFSDSVGASLSVNFRGTGVEVYGETGVDKGKADVYVDGSFVGRINTYSPTVNYNVVLFRITGLSQSNHDIRFEIAKAKSSASNGRYIALKRLWAINTVGDEDKSRKIDSSDYLVRSDGFGVDNDKGYYGGTALYSNSMDSETFVRLSFRGSGIKIYGTKADDSGVGTVILDGESYTYDARSSKVRIVSTLVFELTGLDPNVNHELTLRIDSENNPVGAKAYIVVDYFDIENYSETVFEGYKEIDDGHEDIGRTPVLQWRETEDKEFIFENMRESGCNGTLVGITSEISLIVSACSVIWMKTTKRKDRRLK